MQKYLSLLFVKKKGKYKCAKMKIKHSSSIVYLLVFLLVSCNSREAQEKQADIRLSNIEKLINDNALNSAKIQIDSIHLLFPRLVARRKIAAAFADTIVRRESARTLAYCDSISPLKIKEQDSIQRNFRFEKDTVYQEVGNYVYKAQKIENNTNRNYLKAYVNENADFYLVSNYCGAKIEHSSVQVSANQLFANSDTIEISNAANHSFTDAGTRWEAVTFKNEESYRVSEFILQYQSQSIKVSLHGKKTATYFLTESDKKAVVEAYKLWVVKKDVAKLQKEIKKAKLKIDRIKNRTQ